MDLKKEDVQIVIATHKNYQMPTDSMYLPLHVGAEGKKDINGNDLELGYMKDNTGDNISDYNHCFCELTGLYWAWKNVCAEYIGLVHYRRHFSLQKSGKDPFDNVLTYQQLAPLLKDYKVFVPVKRKYYIETLYTHYKHAHYSVQLDETRKIICEKYPEYLSSYDKVLGKKYGHMFNMMIMQKDLLNEYCTWLFDILFELNERIDMPWLSIFQSRYCGRIAEIIFNVWIDYQIKSQKISQSEIKEIPYIYMEKIKWGKKGRAFLEAKFFNKKYERSF